MIVFTLLPEDNSLFRSWNFSYGYAKSHGIVTGHKCTNVCALFSVSLLIKIEYFRFGEMKLYMVNV